MGASAQVSEHVEGEVDQGSGHPEKIEPDTGQDIDNFKQLCLRSWPQFHFAPILCLFPAGKDLCLRGAIFLSEDALAHGFVGCHAKLILFEDEED